MKWVFHSSSMHLGKNGKPGWRHRFAADALYPGRNGFDGIQSMSNSICKGKICKYSRIWSPSPSSANALDKTSWRALWWLLIIGEFYIKIEITFKNSFSGFLFFCLLPWGVVGALLVASQLVGSCSQTRDQTCIPYIGRWILNCWATREVPCYLTPFGLKLNTQKMKIMASGPTTSWEIDGETVETVSDLFFWAPKSLQMVIAAIKLKDTYSLEGMLWPNYLSVDP